MKKFKFILTTIAFVSAVGAVVASTYSNVTGNKSVLLPSGQGYYTSGTQCVESKFCNGGNSVCIDVSSRTMHQSAVYSSSTQCGATLGQP